MTERKGKILRFPGAKKEEEAAPSEPEWESINPDDVAHLSALVSELDSCPVEHEQAVIRQIKEFVNRWPG